MLSTCGPLVILCPDLEPTNTESAQMWYGPDEDVELLALHLHVILFLVELVLQLRVDLVQFVNSELIRLCLRFGDRQRKVRTGLGLDAWIS